MFIAIMASAAGAAVAPLPAERGRRVDLRAAVRPYHWETGSGPLASSAETGVRRGATLWLGGCTLDEIVQNCHSYFQNVVCPALGHPT